MKFRCDDCRQVMELVEDHAPAGEGALALRYQCPSCRRSISMIANAGETQVVRSLGVSIGHEAFTPPSGPMSLIREALAGPEAAAPDGPEPVWTEAANKRLAAAPGFVQGMIRRLYSDYARRKGYREITPAVMSEAREALGMEEM